jgi:hypothetical protein
MQILLFKGRGLVSRLIQWQSRSPYSHAAIGFPDTAGVTYEATHPTGVRSVYWPDYSGQEVDVFNVVGVTPKSEADALAFAQEQLGKPYDLTMVARFVSRRQEARKSSGKWFCSELAFAVASRARLIFARTEPWEVPPGMLPRSPGLVFSHSFKVPQYNTK